MYRDIQRQQDEARRRMVLKQFAPNAKVSPELVGVWDLSPDNKFLPFRKTLTIQSNADYTVVMQKDGSTSHGKVQGGRGQMRTATCTRCTTSSSSAT
jgi:hypothetical protein